MTDEVCGDDIDNNCDGQADGDCCPCFSEDELVEWYLAQGFSTYQNCEVLDYTDSGSYDDGTGNYYEWSYDYDYTCLYGEADDGSTSSWGAAYSYDYDNHFYQNYYGTEYTSDDADRVCVWYGYTYDRATGTYSEEVNSDLTGLSLEEHQQCEAIVAAAAAEAGVTCNTYTYP